MASKEWFAVTIEVKYISVAKISLSPSPSESLSAARACLVRCPDPLANGSQVGTLSRACLVNSLSDREHAQ